MRSHSKKTNVLLWTIQVVLASLFLFAGSMKLVMPIEMLTKDIALPGLFLRFIGVAEVLGALGLILPGALRIRAWLTPVAAVGLVTIMTGATTITLSMGPVAPAVMPFIVGLLCAFVAKSRWHLVPNVPSSRRAVLQPAT